MSAPDLTPDDVRQGNVEAIAKANTFTTHGVTPQEARQYLRTPEGVLYLSRLEEAAPTGTPIADLQTHAHRGEVRSFHLSMDGERVAVVQEHAPVSEFSVRPALAQPAEQHLAHAHQAAHVQAQEATRTAHAPTAAAPERAMA